MDWATCWCTTPTGWGACGRSSDGAGLVVQLYRYDEYGVGLVSEGGVEQPFRYTGEQFDESTGLVYLRARYYDVQTGRFVSRDKFVGSSGAPSSLHRYTYVRNAPVNLIDPLGLSPQGFNS